ncbi:helix-turn-helix domain-containing protein [Fusibacter sp. JL298sf-3]
MDRLKATGDIYAVENETGSGTMTRYQVLPGVDIYYNAFEMRKCSARHNAAENGLCIHHCKSGRIEWPADEETFLYLSSGDLAVGQNTGTDSFFPMGIFEGITIDIEVDATTATAVTPFAIDLEALVRRFETSAIFRCDAGVEHIFLELYHIPEKTSQEMRAAYVKLKVLELLLYLSMCDGGGTSCERMYFYKDKVEKVKSVAAYMMATPERHYTISELAEHFRLSASTLKVYFKGVYGTGVFAFMQGYRMDIAARRLIETDDSVTEIAGLVGYTNVSKFASTFKKHKGYTPKAYRKIKNQLELKKAAESR